MSRSLLIHRAGPGLTLQDLGRSGYLDVGLSRGGAADRLALFEGAALLGQEAGAVVVEMAAMGGEFEATQDIRIALTGAPMRAKLDGAPLVWNASHLLPAGARLSIGPVLHGCYGYLHVGGGIEGNRLMGAQSAHLSAGVGGVLAAGDRLEIGPDGGTETGMTLDRDDRFTGGAVRIVASFQTHLFAAADLERFCSAPLRRDARANRMGVRLTPEGVGFHVEGGRNVLSEVIIPGDIQITGDGTPFVLMSECQTTGGYPRIGTVVPCDLPRMAQAPAGAEVWFRFVGQDEAVALEQAAAGARAALRRRLRPLIRDPRRMADLLSFQLISGVVSGGEPDT
ncbi:allophanate hydrolase [Rhodovulum imhoffii]|uniref:Allophanate hydrolase n=1 Tax=Rhodovulum imhoffii TaxID=365340 RepID=A0A2T5BTX4_9RHOB|nr:biotin-dependent carboxyltransferase family protein [Rhodovulum imhoffii]MBK5933944.1 urea amidolyase [Rhodovulum imhoffii]PTN02896.1 allophanate hydrolase [Rhodovulum imhoffii]